MSIKLGLSCFVLLLLGSSPAEARSVLLYGGAASARYIYGGAQEWSIFWELADHDLRLRAGGVLFHQRQLSSSDLTTSVFAGAAISASVPGLRMPVGSVQHSQVWRLLPRLELNLDGAATLQPSSVAEVSAASSQGVAVGRPLLLLDGAAAASYRLRRDLFELQLGYESLIHFGDMGTATEEVIAAGAFQLQGTWTHELSARHLLLARPVYRAMLAKTNSFSPTTGLLGGQVGWGLRLREVWRLIALAGVARVVNLPRSHLWAVEPLLNVEGSYRGRRHVWTLTGGWRVRENTYAGGLPMRVVEIRAGWQQPLSSRRWRGAADLGYERLRIGHLAMGPPQRDADTLQAVRLQGLLTWSVARGWRLFAEAGVGVGHLARATAAPCQGAECPLAPSLGLTMNTLLGVAYISATRVADERVLDERVLNLVR